jgi:hypothetical protein
MYAIARFFGNVERRNDGENPTSAARTADGFPASFTRLPAAMVQTLDQAGPVWFAPSKQIIFSGGELDPNDVVQFLSPIQGITSMSTQSVATALKLEAARYRNASSAIPAGILKQTGGEPLNAQELADLASAFNAARMTNQTAALNEYLSYSETLTSPDKMLLIDSAEFQAQGNGQTVQRAHHTLVGVCERRIVHYVPNEGASADLVHRSAFDAYADCIAGNTQPKQRFA